MKDCVIGSIVPLSSHPDQVIRKKIRCAACHRIVDAWWDFSDRGIGDMCGDCYLRANVDINGNKIIPCQHPNLAFIEIIKCGDCGRVYRLVLGEEVPVGAVGNSKGG